MTRKEIDRHAQSVGRIRSSLEDAKLEILRLALEIRKLERDIERFERIIQRDYTKQTALEFPDIMDDQRFGINPN
jgi:peptidoglycan hydrolase CwlO-like protein